MRTRKKAPPKRTGQPINNQAERAVLGAFVMDAEQFAMLRGVLLPCDFFEPKHQALMTALCACYVAGIREFDPVTVNDYLQQMGKYHLWPAWASETTVEAGSSLRAPEYAAIVFANAYERAKNGIADALASGRLDAPAAIAQLAALDARKEQFYAGEAYATNARNAENGSGPPGYSAFSAFSECPPNAFPEPDPAMYYGTAGDIIGGIAPHTEASPVALLVQLLVCVGNAAGRHVYYLAEADRHYPNLYAVMVGDTAKARKGTSWGHIARVLREADPVWETQHIAGGLSSGEGIIHALRNVADADLPAGDAGELLRDKRLLAREPEFASVLAQKARDGNILSMVLRDGWDGGTLGALTKNSPERATNSHLSVIGHITQAELVKCLTSVDAQNGYANRFLFVATKRARLLPHGGDLDAIAEAIARPIRALRTALEWAKAPRKIAHDKDAFALWEREYERLSTGQPGLFGAVTARAEAQVTRLALIYALLDCSPAVTEAHLRAALAVWQFCEDSARYIFGDRLGDAVADRILDELRGAPNGLTRTDLYNLFEHNVASAKIDAALAALKGAGLAAMTKEPTGEKGRPPERWSAAKPTQETH